MCDLNKDFMDMCQENALHMETIQKIRQENNFLRDMFLVQQKMYDEMKHEFETFKRDKDFEIESLKNNEKFFKTQNHVITNQKKQISQKLELQENKLKETKEKLQTVQHENKTLRQRILSSKKPESNNPDTPFGSWLVINLKTSNLNLLKENEQCRQDNEQLREIISQMTQTCAQVSDLQQDKIRLEKQHERMMVEIQNLNKFIEENAVENKKKKMNKDSEKLYSLFSSDITTTLSSSLNSNIPNDNGNKIHNDDQNVFYDDFDFSNGI